MGIGFRSEALALLVALSSPAGVAAGEFGNLAGYEPTTEVTGWAILDLDQRSLEAQLKLGTAESFKNAASIYMEGGHAGSYAVIDIAEPLAEEIEEGKVAHGLKTAKGDDAKGKLVGNYFGGEGSLNVLYHVPRDPSELKVEKMCFVGGLKGSGDVMTNGCYDTTGTIRVGNKDYKYTYDVMKDTYGHITLSSINKMAMREMYRISDECYGCPYPEFVQYHEYYQDMAYGDHWVKGALEGSAVKYLGRGDADFTGMSFKGRADAVKKGTVFLNVFMFVLRNMRLAVSQCGRTCEEVCKDDDDDCVTCDYTQGKAAEAWDQAVALYVGSLEGKDDESQFLYQLAETRCKNFGTCGAEGNERTGTSSVNLRIMKEFVQGKDRLTGRGSGHCDRVENHMSRIWKLMSVPMIQGTLRYAHKMDKKTSVETDAGSKEMNEKRNSEGATFAAAILPRLWTCNADDAEVLYGSMKIGTMYTDFKTVKGIFEANYECLGITCADVGGVIDPETSTYYKGAAPCTGTGGTSDSLAAGTRSQSNSGSKAGIVFGAIIGGAVALLALCFFWKRTQAMKSGKEDIPQMSNPDGFAAEGGVGAPGISGVKSDDSDNELCML